MTRYGPHLLSPWLRDGYIGECSCGKRSFESRKAAKLYGRREYPGKRLQAYRCRKNRAGAWHVGHVAVEVASGEVPKSLFYGPKGVGRVRQKQGTRMNPKTGRVAA
ncbi:MULTISPECIES: hypothetical protein [Nocardia]|uniref:hypothetical protein n=1 Tax=Nocardia TaxID=1817 RepID=UPI001300470E|nr:MULTISPECIES: hypothetical protein [Nocardia]